MDDVRFPDSVPTSADQKVDILLQEIGFAILAKFGEDVLPKRKLNGGLTERDWRHINESSERVRASLDASAIDWKAVNEAVFQISEARLRRGLLPSELTAMEQRVRSERHT